METSNPLLKREVAWSSDVEVGTMNLSGTVNKCGILLLLCLIAGAFSWSQPELQGPFIILGLLGGFVTCLIGMFKPATTPFTAPAYAVMEGLCLGALSCLLNARYPGIMTNALLLTFGVLGMMLVLYTTRIIRVTNRMAMGIFMATAAVGLVYLVDMVMGMFGAHVPFIHESGLMGIGISLVIVTIAAFNLLLDFAVIENNIRQRAPKYMEWYCGMALLVTVVWLYLELLRLLSKLQRR